MAPNSEDSVSDDLDPQAESAAIDGESGDKPEKQKLNLAVQIAKPSACQRHVTVTVPREDIERYFDDVYGELMPTAAVPGFRAGKAPRKLVEHRFRKDVAGQVKSTLLMDCLAQVTEEQKLSAISEPDLDVAAVEIPDNGPLTFEFNLEVRPEFDLPAWQGLEIQRPVRQFTKKDVDEYLQRKLSHYGRLVPHEGQAEAGDYVTVNLSVKDGDQVVNEVQEEVVRIRPQVSFQDATLRGFDKLLVGVGAGDRRQTTVTLTDDAPNAALRGKALSLELEVLEVKKLELPELTPDLLSEVGSFQSEGELRDKIQEDLKMQLEYQQQQRAREQITAALVASADWELPPELLKRQSSRELDRATLEMRRAGFSDADIRTHENTLRQNSAESTKRALKQHFILERLAEDEKIEDKPEDYDTEIRLIAAQSGESPRRVRAYLEKRDLMDVLRNQIIERKAIALVQSKAKFKDVPFEPQSREVEALEWPLGGPGEGNAIPEAKHAGDAKPLTQSPLRG